MQKKVTLILACLLIFASCNSSKAAEEAKNKVDEILSLVKKPVQVATAKKTTAVKPTAAKAVVKSDTSGDDSEYSIAYINDYEGDCELKKKGQEIGEVVNDIYMPLYEGDTVVTEDDSRMEVVFDDATIIKLDSNSRLIIKNLTRTDKTKTIIQLLKGRLYGVVKKLVKNEEFTVRTKMAMAAVKGTELVVETGDEDRIGVYTGQVEVTSYDMDGKVKGSVVLDKDKETIIVKRSKRPERPYRLSKNFMKKYKNVKDIREKIKMVRELRRKGKVRKFKIERRLKRIKNIKTLMKTHPKYRKLTPKQRKVMNEILKREVFYKQQLQNIDKKERRTKKRIKKYMKKKKKKQKEKEETEEEEEE